MLVLFVILVTRYANMKKYNLFKKQKHALKYNHIRVIVCLLSIMQKYVQFV